MKEIVKKLSADWSRWETVCLPLLYHLFAVFSSFWKKVEYKMDPINHLVVIILLSSKFVYSCSHQEAYGERCWWSGEDCTWSKRKIGSIKQRRNHLFILFWISTRFQHAYCNRTVNSFFVSPEPGKSTEAWVWEGNWCWQIKNKYDKVCCACLIQLSYSNGFEFCARMKCKIFFWMQCPNKEV